MATRETKTISVFHFEVTVYSMGITIHYRGTIDDLEQIETMEDRILDLTFSLGGRATMWNIG